MQFFTGSLAKQVGLQSKLTPPLAHTYAKSGDKIIGKEGIP